MGAAQLPLWRKCAPYIHTPKWSAERMILQHARVLWALELGPGRLQQPLLLQLPPFSQRPPADKVSRINTQECQSQVGTFPPRIVIEKRQMPMRSDGQMVPMLHNHVNVSRNVTYKCISELNVSLISIMCRHLVIYTL